MTTPDYAGLEALEQAIIGYWGNRCSDFDGNCPCCQSWKQFDALRALLERNKELERERDEARRQSDRFCDKYLAALSRAEAAEAERDTLAAENERLKEDRARFPDRPDDIGRMIEAHIGNLKAGKESAEALADKAFDRAFQAEAKLAEAMKVIGQIDTALNDQFAAGIEEREGGSARRQERLMKSGEELRRAARKFLKENGNGE